MHNLLHFFNILFDFLLQKKTLLLSILSFFVVFFYIKKEDYKERLYTFFYKSVSTISYQENQDETWGL